MVGTWPRQPRAGEVTNNARVTPSGSQYHVQVKNRSGTYVTCIKLSSQSRANTIRDRLNAIFAEPGADLDFITPSYHNGAYVVCWPHVTWDRNGTTYTNTTNMGKTYEQLYKGCGILWGSNSSYYSRPSDFVVATVSNDELSLYPNMQPWEIALEWANNIRWNANGWSCLKDSTDEDAVIAGFGSSDFTIKKLIVPNGNFTQTVTRKNTIYGLGEIMPSFGTGNTDIFHCCDLTIARPANDNWAYNKWVKVTYGSKSVVARITDQSDHPTAVDLSAGTAYALGISGSNYTLTLSAP